MVMVPSKDVGRFMLRQGRGGWLTDKLVPRERQLRDPLGTRCRFGSDSEPGHEWCRRAPRYLHSPERPTTPASRKICGGGGGIGMLSLILSLLFETLSQQL